MPGCNLVVEANEVRANGRVILEGINLSLAPGLHLVIGPNGSGKTTLLRTVIGAAAYRGRIMFCGETLDSYRNVLSYVPASPQVDQLARVEDVIRASGYGGRLDLGLAERVLGYFGLGVEVVDRRFKSLSSGEQRAVCIARAIARRPKLLLLDEPMAFMDVRNQARLIKLLQEYAAAAGAVVLLTTHELQYVWAGDTVTLLRSGRALYHGPGAGVRVGLLEEAYGVGLEIVEHEGRFLVLPRLETVESAGLGPLKGDH